MITNIFYNTLIIMSLSSTIVQAQPKATSYNPVVAHRGAWKTKGLPENSIASLKEAIRLGCAGSEFDVRMTADDSLIINHDETYQGHKIEESNYAVLAAMPLANGETIPTLQQYIQAGLTDNAGTVLVIEIKPSDISRERAEKIAEKTVRLVQAMKAEKKVCYISFDFAILQKIRSLDSLAVLQYLEGDKSPLELKQASINGADYHFSVFIKHPEWVEQAVKNNIILNVWTVNEKELLQQFINLHFNFITTNEPELLQQLLL